jgi:radical SAM protein with 4Fe4S-binding SPASM domain
MRRKKTMMPRELWEKILHELAEKRMTHKVFFHLLGEPLVHKDVFDALRLANSLGLSVSLYTNGLLLNRDRSCKLLNSLEKGLVVLSMQDISPESFSERCRGAISWQNYIERLQDFMLLVEKQENGFPVQVHCMADIRGMGWNLFKMLREQSRIQAVYDQWRDVLGTQGRRKINIFNPNASYPLGKYCSFFVKQLGNWDNQLIPDEVEVIPRNTGHCVSVTDTFAILSDGTCTYCCDDYEGELDLGNAHERSLEDIYYGKKATNIREAERHGKFIEQRCMECRGTLVFKRSRKPVPSRNILTDYYIFKGHLAYHGFKSATRKVLEAAQRRFLT